MEGKEKKKLSLELKQNTRVDCAVTGNKWGTRKIMAFLSFVQLPRYQGATGVRPVKNLFYLNFQGHIYVGHLHTFY